MQPLNDIDASFGVEAATWETDQPALRGVREQVFLIEQRVPPDEEWDALDAVSFHVLARAADGTPIGTGRLTPARKVGRMAVVKAWRGRGVGEAMLRRLCEQAAARGWFELTLDAQLHAIPFYERAGFVAEGPQFMDAGIPHRLMRGTVARPPGPERRGSSPNPDAELLVAESQAEAFAAVDRVVADARHRLWIYTRDLEPELYGREGFVAAVQRVATSGRGAQVRILVQDAGAAVREPNRLLQLALRLPSYIELRVPVEASDLHYPSAFILNDAGGYFFRTLGSRPEGEGSTRAPGEQRVHQDFFESVWNRAEHDPQLRRLAI